MMLGFRGQILILLVEILDSILKVLRTTVLILQLASALLSLHLEGDGDAAVMCRFSCRAATER